MSKQNHAVYSRASLVRYYSQIHQLQPAEQAILEHLKDQLSSFNMLDIGIGGGRTTHHFLPLVNDYTGIDYSADMISACQQRFSQRFSQSSRPPTLAVMDARNLSAFADNSFDLIVFSFNGLDYVSHEHRLQVLHEIQRVGKPGAYFLFSSHNLRGMTKAFDYRLCFSLNPLKTYVNLVMWALLRLMNATVTLPSLALANHLILKDESHNFRLQTYYIRPEEQLKQLAFGFQDIHIYPWTQRANATALNDAALESDLWLYYFCVVKAA